MAVTDSFRRSYAMAAGAALGFALMLALAWPALELTRGSGRIAALWPANAVILAFTLGRRPTLWPAILAGGWIGNVASSLLVGDGTHTAMALALCNTLETAVCAYGLRRWAGPWPDLGRQRDFTAFACLSIAAPIASGLVMAGYFFLLGQPTSWKDMITWILADGLGLLILTPALLVLSRARQRRVLLEMLRAKPRLPLVLFALLLVASAAAPWHSAFLIAPPILVMATLEYEIAGAAAAMLVLALVSCLLTLMGLAPAVFPGDQAERLLRLQGFLALTAAIILPLGSVVAQRAVSRRDLAAARDRAEAALAAKGEFLANMSHELRTPLTSIIGFAGLLRDEALDDRQNRYVRRITDASQALLAVINDVLDFSKLEAGELALDPQPVDPDALIHQTVALVSLQAETKGLALRIANGPLPSAVHLDEGRFRQVLLNLVSNAVKFTEAGEVCVTADYASHRSGALKVSVADTGPGVPPDRLDRLFQRFSQADGSISRRYGGTGLGLAICRRLVELMGGAISVETAAGQGSTFTFDVAAPIAPPQTTGETEAAAFADASVLLVDDAAANRELVRTLLEALGVRVSDTDTGEAALALTQTRRFDLILLDIRMPGMDGLAVARNIRKAEGPNRLTPILALTADVQQSDVDACREAGMNDHIAKPVNVADLLSKTARWSSMSYSVGARA
jgi:signal transduction histidine kinase/ActR/RegA family two-component response regulator